MLKANIYVYRVNDTCNKKLLRNNLSTVCSISGSIILGIILTYVNGILLNYMYTYINNS